MYIGTPLSRSTWLCAWPQALRFRLLGVTGSTDSIQFERCKQDFINSCTTIWVILVSSVTSFHCWCRLRLLVRTVQIFLAKAEALFAKRYNSSRKKALFAMLATSRHLLGEGNAVAILNNESTALKVPCCVVSSAVRNKLRQVKYRAYYEGMVYQRCLHWLTLISCRWHHLAPTIFTYICVFLTTN